MSRLSKVILRTFGRAEDARRDCDRSRSRSTPRARPGHDVVSREEGDGEDEDGNVGRERRGVRAAASPCLSMPPYLERCQLRWNTQRSRAAGQGSLKASATLNSARSRDRLGLGRAKLRLAREFVSHSCDRLTKIAGAPRDSSARKRIGPRVTLALPSTIMPATPRSPS